MKKMNHFLLMALLMGAATFVTAQPVKKGTNIIGVAVGFGSSITPFTGGNLNPSFSVQYERGVWKVPGPGVVTLGGYVGFLNYKYAGSTYNQKFNYTIVGVRGAYHYNGFNSGSDNRSKVDVYAGVMVSANILTYSFDGNFTGANSYGTDPYVSPFIGARYFFAKNIAVTAEAGYGVSFLNVGLAFKF